MRTLAELAPHANCGPNVIGEVFVNTYVFTKDSITGFLLGNLKNATGLVDIGATTKLINRMAGRTLVDENPGNKTYLENSTSVGLVVSVPEKSVHYILTVPKDKLLGYIPK